MVLLISLNVGGYSGRNILDSPLANLSVNTQRAINININTDNPSFSLFPLEKAEAFLLNIYMSEISEDWVFSNICTQGFFPTL